MLRVQHLRISFARNLILIASSAIFTLLPTANLSANDFCPNIYDAGRFGPLNINPAFAFIDEFEDAGGQRYEDLVFSSFYNAIKNPQGTAVESFFEPDLIARIRGIHFRQADWFDKDRDVEILTDLDLAEPVTPNGPGQQVWPNEITKVPNGVLPFQAIVSPQGFMVTEHPGRLTIINMDDAGRQEYVVHQSLQNGTVCVPPGPGHDPNVKPAFYHLVKWFDMDGDGLKDIVTARSGFKLVGVNCAPTGEVLWFKNPGEALDPDVEWQEFVVAGFPLGNTFADLTIDMHDLENDGVPEILGMHFFTGELIMLYGAPVGQTWADVNLTTNPPRFTPISEDQGAPFGAKFVDLNRDGKMDVLATNHQSDNCFPQTSEAIPGRVYALEQPADGNIFTSPWTTHVLKDNIWPNPTYPAPNGPPGRLAPGFAVEFWPSPFSQAFKRPWILVGGDEASKVWVMKPESQDAGNWNYLSAAIFDINDFYGPNTSQMFTAPPPATGVSISTIGQPVWRFDKPNKPWLSRAEIFIPVFEGRDIFRITFENRGAGAKLSCPPDVRVACPAPGG